MKEINRNTITSGIFEECEDALFNACGECSRECIYVSDDNKGLRKIPIGALLYSDKILDYKIRIFNNQTVPAIVVRTDLVNNKSRHIVSLCMAQNWLRFQEKYCERYGEENGCKFEKTEILEESLLDYEHIKDYGFLIEYDSQRNGFVKYIKDEINEVYNTVQTDDDDEELIIDGLCDYTLKDMLNKLKKHNVEMCAICTVRDCAEYPDDNDLTHIYIDHKNKLIIFHTGTIEYYFDGIKNDVVNTKLFSFVENLNQSIEHHNDMERFFDFVYTSYNHEVIDSEIFGEALRFYGIKDEKLASHLSTRYELLISFLKTLNNNLCIML